MATEQATWEVLLPLDRARPGLAEQLAGVLRAAIGDGRLPAGTQLPSTRGLAADLRVSRGVVVAAYEQLSAEGRLTGRRGSGTLVSAVPAPTVDRGRTPEHAPGVAPLRPGVPDLGMFPRTAWRRAYESALSQAMDADLGYGDPAGAPRLRQELARYLGRVRAAQVDAAALLVTTGAAQAFAIVAAALRGRGETRIGIEDPGSAPIRAHFEAHGVRPVPIPVDADGLDVAALVRTRLRAVLVTPAHQSPTGVVLAPARRAALVEWARRVGGLVVEDDYDAEFRYDRDPVGCMQGLAPDVVALVGSVSKGLAPALRLGWLAVPGPLLGRATALKAAADLGGPAIEQLAFARLLAGGGYDRHLRRARRVYRHRRDAVVRALGRHLPQVRVSGVAAGLHLVVELPDGTDDVAVAAAARAAGLGPLPLSQLRLRGPAGAGPGARQAGLVIGYAAHSPNELDAAVRRLAEALAGADSGSSPPTPEHNRARRR